MVVRERICEVYATRDGIDWECGSGTLLSAGVVLTAAHVVFPATARRPAADGAGATGTDDEAADQPAVRVRLLGDRRLWRAEVVWHRKEATVDAALLRITDPGFVDPRGLPPVRWGRLVCDRGGAEVEAVGFPRVRVQPDEARETEHLRGHAQPLGLMKLGRLDVAVESPPKPSLSSKQSPWSGMSGAGLYCNQILVGVVAYDEDGFDSRRVSAVPVTAFLGDPEFRAQLWPGDPDVVPGLEPAELDGLQVLVRVPESPASLLRADAEVVAFHGREELLGRLDEWCGRTEVISAFLLTGPGGQGKTRLARHFAARMRRREWAVVVLNTSSPTPETLDWLRSVSIDLLLVVDYAEGRIRELEALTPVLSGRRPGRRLRVLLLARSDGEWRKPEQAAWDFVATAGSEHLPKLDADPAASRETFGTALSAFARRLSGLPDYQDIPWARYASRIEAPPFPSAPAVLGVQMVALARLLETAQPASERHSGESVEVLLTLHEERYWHRTLAQQGLGLRPGLARIVVATACLVPAADEQAAAAVLARVPELEPARPREVAAWLRSLYPDAAQWWSPLQPDLLAEHLVGAVLRVSHEVLSAVLSGVDTEQGERALTVLTRAAVHQPDLGERIADVVVEHAGALARAAVTVATRTAEPGPLLAALEQLVDVHRDDLDLLLDLHRSIAPSTQLHADLAVRVAERLVELRRGRSSAIGGTGWRAVVGSAARRTASNQLARSLNHLALRLRHASRHEDALSAVEEAVAIQRRLAGRHPRFRQDLAASLNDLSYCLAELGRRDEALVAITDAVRIRRQLAAEPPGDPAELARALNNLSNCLAELGRHDEALAAIEETVSIRRGLPDAEVELARALNNLSVTLGYLDRGPDALAAIDQAEAVFRRLAEERPDEFLPEHAATLSNRAIRLIEVGRPEYALQDSSDAIALYRRLIERSETSRSGLAAALTNRSNCLAEIGRGDEALFDIEGAVNIYRRLDGERPEVFRADFRKALNSHSDRLREVGRTAQADRVDQEIKALDRVGGRRRIG
ncbi:tetratricopeptide repeat protein [Plantactinospora soyae]|uniref:Tetratricopeptide (TPR) repeat protein n=1 Tax=Plantactinospora soyae TaxID=1544732 RepID=A0A927QUQ3_9ACTN|nr:tetratricopeptide repeat protein [Plantactinospora soyae]MBE1484845.1 tetratricopeptide (TPR) repeat protein [Plantactinospora soyae]